VDRPAGRVRPVGTALHRRRISAVTLPLALLAAGCAGRSAPDRDEATARSVGYDSPDPQRQPDPNTQYTSSLSRADGRRYVQALFGTAQDGHQIRVGVENGIAIGRPADGCLAEAERRLYGDLTIWSTATHREGRPCTEGDSWRSPSACSPPA
jgi:hypothetical protein